MTSHVAKITFASIRGQRSRGGLLRRLAHTKTLWKSRADLRDLDARMLDDIGITEVEARREADRPIWDVPANWRA